jgi:hypothetical protein
MGKASINWMGLENILREGGRDWEAWRGMEVGMVKCHIEAPCPIFNIKIKII